MVLQGFGDTEAFFRHSRLEPGNLEQHHGDHLTAFNLSGFRAAKLNQIKWWIIIIIVIPSCEPGAIHPRTSHKMKLHPTAAVSLGRKKEAEGSL